MSKVIINTDKAPEAIGTYSQAVKIRNTVYLSGQIALDPATMEMQQQDFVTEAKRVFDNLTAVCEAAGGTLQDMVKLNIYLLDLGNFTQLNEV
ncbi:MAG: RidA family protein, partial [Algicola sp.]|nr:RidA family protein [Algicola sp.]